MRNYFYTESLNVAAWLVSRGFNIDNTTKIGNLTRFNFIRSEQLISEINNYNQNIELKKFITAFRDVKRLLK
jgi:hypothetical protein